MKNVFDTAKPVALTGTNLGDSAARRPAVIAATAICLVLLALALTFVSIGSTQGMAVPAFIPFAATNWAIADMLTSFLLLAQYYASKRTYLAVLAFGYAASGLLSGPYLLEFPGVLWTAQLSIADQQIPVYLWLAWHFLFTGSILVATFIERDRKEHEPSREAASLWVLISGTLAVTGLITFTIIQLKESLPVLLVNGRFQAQWSMTVIPALLAMAVAAFGFIAAGWRRLSNLHLWLLVAVFADGLDLMLNMFSNGRFSYNWYLGKCETIFTAVIVLFMLMSDVADMYRKLADIATMDPLTGLHNRRSFDNHLGFILTLLRRNPSHLAMLVIDIDHFKNFNDAFGHAVGDTILARVAAALTSVVTRPLDMVARWGGEEFVVILPDTEREGALTLADEARRIVESMQYVSAEGKVAAVTISIGIAYVSRGELPNSMDLFKTADASLYEAKANGRNRVAIRDYQPTEFKVQASVH